MSLCRRGMIVALLVSVCVVHAPQVSALRVVAEEPYLQGITLPAGGMHGGDVGHAGGGVPTLSTNHTLGVATAAMIGIAIRDVLGYPRGVPSRTVQTTGAVRSKHCNISQNNDSGLFSQDIQRAICGEKNNKTFEQYVTTV